MNHSLRVAAVLLVLLGSLPVTQAGEQAARGFDPLRDSLARRPGAGRLMTFSQIRMPGLPAPDIVRLVSAHNVHAGDVATRKMAREEFKALQQHWR